MNEKRLLAPHWTRVGARFLRHHLAREYRFLTNDQAGKLLKFKLRQHDAHFARYQNTNKQ